MISDQGVGGGVPPPVEETLRKMSINELILLLKRVG